MEKFQIEIIEKNKVELIKLTKCYTEFISYFTSVKILGPSDVEILDSFGRLSTDQSSHFYKIIQTRIGSFDVLLKALESTNQTGALNVLQNTNIREYGLIKYNKGKLLGKGSYGTKVYEGSFDNRNAAVKVLVRDENDPHKAEQEIKFLIELDNHKNIVRYFFMEQNLDFVYIALELCVINLQEAVRLGKLNGKVLEVLQKCTEGLAHLHKHNILHRDLKPTNILLNQENEVKLSDFGLSKEIPGELNSVTVGSVFGGSPDWMAPEVYTAISQGLKQNVKIKTSSDIFSLGCIFYYVSTNGTHPFGKPFERLNKIQKNKPILNERSLGPDFCNLVSKMIAYDHRIRPSVLEVLKSDCFRNPPKDMWCCKSGSIDSLQTKNVTSSRARLLLPCEEKKKDLSCASSPVIKVGSIVSDDDMKVKMTKDKFEELCEPCCEKIVRYVDEASRDAQLKKHEIDEIMLVGNSIRIPKVQKTFTEYFNVKRLNYSINPDETHAYDAAVHAAMLNDKQAYSYFVHERIEDVVAHSIGIEVLEKNKTGVFSVIIGKNTKYPTTRKVTYRTAHDNQVKAAIKLYQGESPVAKENYFLGEFFLDGIPPAPATREQVVIELKVDPLGNLGILATSQSSGTSKKLQVTLSQDF